MTTTVSAQDSPAWQHLHRKLAELRGKHYLPVEMVAIVSKVAELHQAALNRVRFADSTEQALPQDILASLPSAEARAQGAFLLSPTKFPLDMNLVAELVPALLDLLAETSEPFAPLKRELEQALHDDPSLLERACSEALASPPRPAGKDTATAVREAETSCFAAWEEKHPEAPSFFRFVIQSALMPSITATARLLGERHPQSPPWSHGHCPVCGSLPLMGRLTDAEGARMHACSFCSFEYRVPRVSCPFCLAEPADGVDYLSSEEEPGYLVELCPSCNNYIKLADFRKFDRVWLPMLDDLASLPLDFHARQKGYTRPTLSAWGF